jgi:phasin family protein
MFSFQEQFSAAAKTNFESQLALVTMLTGKAFESVEKLIALNLNAAKASLDETTSHAQQLMGAKGPQEVFAMTSSKAQPGAEKALAYGRELMGIASGLQAEVVKAAEAQVAEHGRKLSTLVEEVSKKAPAGSENVVAILKSAIANANAGVEQLSRNTKQAVQVMEANMNNAAVQFSQAASKAGSQVASFSSVKK